MNAAEAFREAFDRSATGVWSAPGRVNLIGEHTDYNGGYVLPFAIDPRTDVAASRRDDRQICVRSLQRADEAVQVGLDDLAPGAQLGWSAYVLGAIWALRKSGHDIGGLDIVVDGRVPTGAGLSSSAALECAVSLAALELYQIDIDREELARIAQYAENEFVGVPCGLMDQMAVSVCRADHALFFDVRDDVREHVPFAPAADGLALLVIDTRAQHANSDGAYAQRRQSCEEAARQLGVRFLRDIAGTDLDDALSQLDDDVLRRRARHIITENDRVLAVVAKLRDGRPRDIGPLMTASHVSLRDDFEVSATELDVAVDAALSAGAIGARMTGGGFGGSAIALVRAADGDAVAHAITAAFAQHHLGRPSIFSPSASAGVTRES